MKLSNFAAMCGVVTSVAGFSGAGAAETLAERGSYLVKSIGGCGNCHTARGGPMKGV